MMVSIRQRYEKDMKKKQQERRFYTVREIKTGRIFQAEYDSESAAYYEKGTGREYDLSEVEDV